MSRPVLSSMISLTVLFFKHDGFVGVQQLPAFREAVPFVPVRQKSEVPYSHQAFGQDMEKEASDEFDRIQQEFVGVNIRTGFPCVLADNVAGMAGIGKQEPVALDTFQYFVEYLPGYAGRSEFVRVGVVGDKLIPGGTAHAVAGNKHDGDVFLRHIAEKGINPVDDIGSGRLSIGQNPGFYVRIRRTFLLF